MIHVSRLLLLAAVGVALTAPLAMAENPRPLKLGIIGLDASHSLEFANVLNDPKAAGELAGARVVAAFPGGSKDMPHSFAQVKPNAEKLRGMGVEIVASIEELLPKVDAVLLESVDGRPHLAQARLAIAAGKPLFVNKPMAASLADAMEIFRLAKEKKVPCFSSSGLRYCPGISDFRQKKSPLGDAKDCLAWSPLNIEPHHPDLFWYGIHGVETLYAIMGPGCKTVARVAPDRVVGVWADGRVGAFVADGRGYGAIVHGTKGSGFAGEFKGYKPLVVEIVRFFRTGKPPIAAEETLEILAFMEAADESKRQGGAPVSLQSVLQKAAERPASR